MAIPTGPETHTWQWAERFAGQIHDPVRRLRFLRAVVRVEQAKPKRRPPMLPILMGTLILCVPGVAVLMHSAGLTEPGKAEITSKPGPRTERPKENLPAFHNFNPVPDIWLVERAADSETFSNGLRIDTRLAVRNGARGYLAFPAEERLPHNGVPMEKPAGIVFHTTESFQAPFEARENGVLKKATESLVEYIRRKRAYHYLIDRFGRVSRIVEETDVAYHAGYSVWSDEQWLYVNLNDSFLAVAFEAHTEPGQTEATTTPAQVRAAGALTDMLRSRYGIAAGNCVTHAQVSVNPSNMQVGYHTDWASSFPYAELGLPDNYSRALPALSVFGFEYDPVFTKKTGVRVLEGVESAEKAIEEQAAATGKSVAAVRKDLRIQYRYMLSAVRRGVAPSEAE